MILLKIKIAFVTNQMVMGGIERSLISILENIPMDKFDVTVYVMRNGGDLISEIPKEVKIKYIFKEKTTLNKICKYLKKGKYLSAFKVALFTYLLKKGSRSKFHEGLYYSRMLPIETTRYDIAVSFFIPTSLPVIYVIKNMKANKKIAWIHSDVSEFKEVLPKYSRYYKRYDNIFGVSKYSIREFLKMFPYLEGKTSTFYNIIDNEKLKLLAQQESFRDYFDGIRILTIGRLEKEKGQDLIPEVLKKLLEKGLHVHWYCIGEGKLRPGLEKKIWEYGLYKNMSLLGAIDNPYPFIKDCDIYVQPSRHESFCITVAEAKVFNKPIITTNTGASEQIVHDETGLITEFNEKELANAVTKLISEGLLRNKFKRNLSEIKTDTTNEIKKLYGIIGHIS